jgi:hypothetical protein
VRAVEDRILLGVGLVFAIVSTSSCRESTSPLMESRPGCGTAAEGARTQAVFPPALPKALSRGTLIWQNLQAFIGLGRGALVDNNETQRPSCRSAVRSRRPLDQGQRPVRSQRGRPFAVGNPSRANWISTFASAARFLEFRTLKIGPAPIRGVSTKGRKISVREGLCGGAGRTRTSSQTIISSWLAKGLKCRGLCVRALCLRK